MRKLLFALLVLVVVLTPLVMIAVQGQQNYFALMLVCGGTYDSRDLHMGQFDSEASAKAWADSEMTGMWDIAYIYDSWTRDGSMRLLWARSESSCYPDMSQWRRFQ